MINLKKMQSENLQMKKQKKFYGKKKSFYHHSKRAQSEITRVSLRLDMNQKWPFRFIFF